MNWISNLTLSFSRQDNFSVCKNIFIFIYLNILNKNNTIIVVMQKKKKRTENNSEGKGCVERDKAVGCKPSHYAK